MSATECYCDYEPTDFYNRTTPKARIEHRCEECNRTIQPGESYEYISAKWTCYDAVEIYKTCSHCLSLRQWVQAHIPCFCWHHGNMRQDARDAIEEYRHECPGLWFGWARLEMAVRKAYALDRERKRQ